MFEALRDTLIVASAAGAHVPGTGAAFATGRAHSRAGATVRVGPRIGPPHE